MRFPLHQPSNGPTDPPTARGALSDSTSILNSTKQRDEIHLGQKSFHLLEESGQILDKFEMRIDFFTLSEIGAIEIDSSTYNAL